jgi:hypothetical protein
MEVVVLTEDSARARFGGLGPFASKPWYDAPYAAFARAGRARGLDIVIAHYDDLDLTQRRVDAWGLLQGGKWESRLIYSEFFYDKFPTDVNTTPLRDRIKSDPRIQIWNRIVFTDLLADKFELSRLLDGSGVPAVSPTRRLELNAGRDAREALLVELEQETRQDGLVPAGEGRWIVVKPLTGWGGQGVDRMTTADFLDRDFHVAPYDRFGALVVQPFFESEVDVAELDIKGRHDVRVVFVGSTPVFGMIRELSPGLDVCAASLENIRRYGGRRRYIEVQELLRRPDAAALVNRVPVALGGLLGATPAIYSVDFCWVRAGGRLMPIVIELNSKPSQIWEEHDEDGRRVILKFHDAIVRQLAAFHDERVAPRS